MERAPQRIVSMAPSNTETVFALGAGSRLVGVTDYCDYPPEAKDVESIGTFADASLERIVSLQPDLVLAARFNSLDVINGLKRLGIPVFALAPDEIESTMDGIRDIGALIGNEDAAKDLLECMNARIANVNRLVSQIPETDRPRVLWGRLEVPMYSAGPGSYIHDLLQTAGGRNIVGDSKAAWPQVGLETLVDRNPQVIIVSTDPSRLRAEIVRLQNTDAWREIDAIQTGRVLHIETDLLQRPGPRLVDALEAVARALHPNRFRAETISD